MISIPSPRSKKRPRIEIIPLIDIVFFLLATFVMVSLSMVKNQGIAVNLPSAVSGIPQEHANATTISLDADGLVYWNKEALDEARFDAALRQLQARESDPRIFINGDERTPFGKTIGVLDRVRKRGITKVAIQTQPAKAVPEKP
ncbi:MAG: biopolymer transporter ExbD [Verrucomicrobia bacterium]|nr:biopolymer transporter ExbD [Verrucomicrobiota bacterium]